MRKSRRTRNTLAVKHLGLVISTAQKIIDRLPPSYDLEDLIGIGNIALLKAAERYDPAAHAGTTFGVYARHVIRGAMLENCRRKPFKENTRPSIDLESTEHEKSFRPSEVASALAKHATQPEVEALIDRARLSERVAEAISWLPEADRMLLAVWYDRSEPHLQTVARSLRMTQARAKEIHSRALAELRRRLTGAPVGLTA